MCLFFILLLNVVSADNVKYICTINHTVKLESDNVVFFESPDFPRFMTDIEHSQCAINFTKSLNVTEEDKRFVIVVPNIFCTFISQMDKCHNYDFDATNIASYFFHLNDKTLAFQGFAYFDDWGDDCPFESISRINPFEFTDITQILVIRSTFTQYTSRKQSCLWQFKAPEDYGFKIVITNFNIRNDTIFKVENRQDVIITTLNVRNTYPHYTVDNYIKIYLSKRNFSYPGNNGYEFEAYITIVKNNLKHVSANCTVIANDNYTTWSYWNEIGYPNNARCTFPLKIMPKTEVIAKINKLKVETNVDVINYYCCNSSVPNYNGLIYTDSLHHAGLAFAGDVNAEREVLWEFRSDGTVNSRGFEVQFETKNCTCADPLVVVPCFDVLELFLMKSDVHQNERTFYCGNLECNFTVKLDSSCYSHFILLTFLAYGYTENNDLFRVISNNMILPKQMNDILIPSANENIFQAITVSSTFIRYLTVKLSALNISSTLPTITINETKPFYFHEFDLFNEVKPYMIVIQLSSELKERGSTINIFDFRSVYDSSMLGIYSNSNLTDPLDLSQCFVWYLNTVYKCKTNMNSFALVVYGVVYNNFIFQVTDGQNTIGAEGCVFKNNVFGLDYVGSKVFSAMSNSRTKCKMLLYSFEYGYIQKIWLSPHSNGSVSISFGASDKSLVKFDAESSFIWRDLPLFPTIYVIEIPLNSVAMFTGYYDHFDVTNITSVSCKTIVTSPYSGANKVIHYDFNSGPFRTLNIFDNKVKITILDRDILLPNYFYFGYNGTYTNITSTLYTIEAGPPFIEFYCTCPSHEHCDIRMLVETYNSIEPNTTTKTTVLTSSSIMTPISTTLTIKEKSLSFMVTLNYLLMFAYCFCEN